MVGQEKQSSVETSRNKRNKKENKIGPDGILESSLHMEIYVIYFFFF